MFTEDSDNHDIDWHLDQEFSTDHEARVTISGYKHPASDFPGRPAYSESQLHADFTVGERWSHYDTIHFGCTNGGTNEEVLNDLGKTIEMLQEAYNVLYNLTQDFPSPGFDLETFKSEHNL